MRHARIAILFVALWSLLAAGCGGEGATSGTGADSMLGLLPEEATGVFFVDIQKAMAIPSARDALTEKHEKLEEFIAETGIDPTRDLLSMVGAMTGRAAGKDADGVVVMRVKLDSEAMITKVEEKHGKLSREDYRGVVIHGLPAGEAGKPASLAFLDESTLAMGTPTEVRTVIDVHQERAASLLENSDLMAIVRSTDREAIFWAAFTFTKEDMTGLTEGNPMLAQLSGIQSVVLSFDYRDRTFNALIECRSETGEQNQQIADLLTGIKGFAAMGAAENPALGELLRTVEITASPENIRVTAAIPEDLLARLEESAQKS